MPLSHSSSLRVISSVFATIWIGFGVNALLRPTHALSFFEFQPPAGEADRKLVESLVAVYGVRDIFMGLVTAAATAVGDRKTLGWILILGSAVAVADGAVCWQAGTDLWSHVSYAPMIAGVGSLLLGVLDRS